MSHDPAPSREPRATKASDDSYSTTRGCLGLLLILVGLIAVIAVIALFRFQPPAFASG